MRRHRTQAFRQSPWRVQVRSVGKSLQWLVIGLVVGGLYLAINAKVARSGREILVLEDRREDFLRSNSELTAMLAAMTTPSHMMDLAYGAGFLPAGLADIVYLPVENYVPIDPFVAPRPPAEHREGGTMLSPTYTETLADWLTRWLGLDGGGGR